MAKTQYEGTVVEAVLLGDPKLVRISVKRVPEPVLDPKGKALVVPDLQI